jgi:GNAT superfamily N-acetyltransferase
MNTATVTTITTTNEHKAAGTLASAFATDPVFRWIYPDEGRLAAVLPPVFEIFTSVIARHGASQLLGDADAAALWVPPGEELVAESEMEAFITQVTELAPLDAERVLTAFELMAAVHPTEPCWYLNFIGVDAERQGRGYGSALLRAGLERADGDGVPSYLEATSPENRRLYERHGFVAVGSIDLPSGPSMTPMWREPGAAWAI